MTAFAWNLPKPIAGGTWPDNPSASGGQAQDGSEQNVFNLGMRLKAQWTVPIRSTADVIAARAFQARMKGKSGTCLVPLFDGKQTGWPIVLGVPMSPKRTRNRRLDGTAYEDPAIPAASEVRGTLLANYDYHVTYITFHLVQGQVPVPGQWFCLGGTRSYLIEDVDTLAGTANYGLDFIPPLRAPAATSAAIDFAKLYCIMGQTKSDQGIQMLDGMQFATLDMEFVEVFDDP